MKAIASKLLNFATDLKKGLAKIIHLSGLDQQPNLASNALPTTKSDCGYRIAKNSVYEP